MNILFLNGGRRCELLELFRSALSRRGGGRIVVSDISAMAPALYKADVAASLPRTSAPEFPEALAELVRRERIDLLIPSIDPDLAALDALRGRLAELCPAMTLLLSPSETVRTGRDKRLSKELFSSLGAEVPDYVEPSSPDIEFPLFVKPPDGSSSVGAKLVNDAAELKAELAANPKLMVERVVGGPEYTVDVLCDFSGKALCAVPRRRIKVRAGEVCQGVVEMRRDLIELSMRLAEGFGSQGPVTLQFRMPEEGRYVAMELNARMGGGLPLAVAAGADWPGMILDLVEGRAPNLRFEVRDGLLMSRYDSSVFFMPGKLPGFRNAVPRLSKGLLDGLQALVLDLDDTIYLERDFVMSAYSAVAEIVWRDLGVEIECVLKELFLSGRRGDNFTEAFRIVGVTPPEGYVLRLVEIYRSHPPRIRPCLDFDVVRRLRGRGLKIGLVSNGWKAVQMSKVEALGIAPDFDSLIITDALGGLEFWKPSPEPFKRVMRDLDIAPEKAVYVGDNPEKDFIGSRAIGMKTLRILRPGGVYGGNPASSAAHEPDAWISSFTEIEEALK
jgi:phosphoglycolate phosphatase-like HAD superfamily hydrolase